MKPIGVSFHVFPHMMSNGPLPALGYVKAYAESRMSSLTIRPIYWSTSCIRVFRHLGVLGNSSSIEGDSRAQSFFEDLFVAVALSQGEFQDESKLKEILHSCDLLIQPKKSRKSLKSDPGKFLQMFSKWLDSKSREFGCFEDDIVACSFGSIQSLQSLSFLSFFREKNPEAWFVVGGLTQQQAKLLLEAAPFVDIAVFGEGEASFLEICRARQESLPLESIEGIAFRQGSSVVVNDRREPISEIDGHWADYRGFDWAYAAEGGSDVDLPIWDSRNCWWGRCEFCDFMRTQQEFVERSPEDIKGEIDEHIARDPVLTQMRTRVMLLGLEACGSDKKRFERILDDLIDLKRRSSPEMNTFFELSPRNSAREILRRLDELNAKVQWGFEQVNRTLEICNKSHRIEHVIHTLKLAGRFPNVRIAGFNLMISVPDDSLENCLEMRDNLWLLRFVFSVLFRQRQMQLLRPLQIDVCEGIAFGKRVDFSSVGVREDLSRQPWVNRYSAIVNDQEKAISFGATFQLTVLPDDSVTREKYLSVIEEFSENIDSYFIRVHENRDGGIVIAMQEENLSIETVLSASERKVLSETAGPRKLHDLKEALGDSGSARLGEALAGLARHGLIWYDVKRQICINTLPPGVQDSLDLVECEVRG
jgi:hypothetical protein